MQPQPRDDLVYQLRYECFGEQAAALVERLEREGRGRELPEAVFPKLRDSIRGLSLVPRMRTCSPTSKVCAG